MRVWNGAWQHARAHRFFADARWCTDAVGLALVDLVVARLLPAGAPVTVVVDDTLFKRSGRKVFGAAWHHDGAAKGPKPVGFGNCPVVAGIVVDLPLGSRPVCLPVLARLWRPRRTGKIAFAREMVEQVAARHLDRAVHAVGDAAYAGEHLRRLGTTITWTSRLKVTSVLHELAPPRTGRSGRPRTRGARLGTRPTSPPPRPGARPRSAATDAPTRCRSPRSPACGTGRSTPRPCGSFWCVTPSHVPATATTAATGCRWSPPTWHLRPRSWWPATPPAGRFQVAFSDARQILGVGEARNRTRRAVERTVPFGLVCLSLVTVWYATAGHTPAAVAAHRVTGPLVHHQDRTVLRRHDRQAAPSDHRRQIFGPKPPTR